MGKFLSRGPLWVFLISAYSSDASGFYSFVKCVGAFAEIPFRKALILMGLQFVEPTPRRVTGSDQCLRMEACRAEPDLMIQNKRA